jgi:antirestriction protein ArdC
MVEQLHEQLAVGIRALNTREDWQHYLTFAAGFHTYSFGNQLLIMMQRPDATAVAGYRAWHAKGHQVRRGEKAIRVLGPVTRSAPLTDSSGHPLLDEAGKQRQVREVVGVKPVSVFDICQTDGPPPPVAPRPVLLVGEAPPGLWQSLAQLVDREGFGLERGDCDGANGITDFSARVVRVRDDVDDAQAVKTLAHELGHVLLTDATDVRGFVECRGLREVEAESVAYMVTAAHGLDASQYTFNYVTGWANQTNGDQTAEQVVRSTGQRVVAAVGRILAHTDPQLARGPVDALEADLDLRLAAVTPGREPIRQAPDSSEVKAPDAAALYSLTYRRGRGVAR